MSLLRSRAGTPFGWALLLGVGSLLASCDRFWAVGVIVTSCAGGEPIQGAIVTTHLIDGLGEPDDRYETNASGRANVTLNEPPTSLVEVSIIAQGYADASFRLRGAHALTFETCLDRVEDRGREKEPIPAQEKAP